MASFDYIDPKGLDSRRKRLAQMLSEQFAGNQNVAQRLRSTNRRSLMSLMGAGGRPAFTQSGFSFGPRPAGSLNQFTSGGNIPTAVQQLLGVVNQSQNPAEVGVGGSPVQAPVQKGPYFYDIPITGAPVPAPKGPGPVEAGVHLPGGSVLDPMTELIQNQFYPPPYPTPTNRFGPRDT